MKSELFTENFVSRHFQIMSSPYDEEGGCFETAIVKKHKCPYCPFSSLRTADVKRHVMIHTGERPYKCSVCESTFKRKEHLHGHMYIHFKNKKKVK